jgi:hypothetical protein
LERYKSLGSMGASPPAEAPRRSLIWASLLSIVLTLQAWAPALAQGTDYQLDFEAADPSTYDHLTGEGALAIHDTSVESLQASDFFCGDVVVFLLHITAPSGLAAPETIEVDFAWDAEPTGQPGAGYTDLLEAEPNTADPAMATDGGEAVSIESETIAGSPQDLLATVRITDLESDEIFVLRLEVRITCIRGSDPTGNLHARLADPLRVIAPEPRNVSVGAQDVPMIGTPEFRPGTQPTPPPSPPTGGVQTGAGGTADDGSGALPLLAGLILLGALGIVTARMVLNRRG